MDGKPSSQPWDWWFLPGLAAPTSTVLASPHLRAQLLFPVFPVHSCPRGSPPAAGPILSLLKAIVFKAPWKFHIYSLFSWISHWKCTICFSNFNDYFIVLYLTHCLPNHLAIKNPTAMQETRVRSLGWEDLLEKEMATHSSILAWEIPWTEEPDRLQSMVSQRVRCDWEVTHA